MKSIITFSGALVVFGLMFLALDYTIMSLVKGLPLIFHQ